MQHARRKNRKARPPLSGFNALTGLTAEPTAALRRNRYQKTTQAKRNVAKAQKSARKLSPREDSAYRTFEPQKENFPASLLITYRIYLSQAQPVLGRVRCVLYFFSTA